MINKGILLILILLSLAACTAPTELPAAESTIAAGTKNELVLAAEAAVVDSGLLDAILPDFERKTGIAVRVLAVDADQALEAGYARTVDALLLCASHDPEREQAFVDAGAAPGRYAVISSDLSIDLIPCSILPVMPTAAAKTNFGAATAFVTWITGVDAQALIAAFGRDAAE